jgi:uncharacterized protein (DUF2336 family)
MAPTMADANHLLGLARDKSVEGRKRLVAIVADLLSERETVVTAQERVLMTDILKKLIHDVALPVRRALSERLATAGNVPHEIVVILANDEIDVAAPILLKSDALLDIELIEIVRHRSLDHQLTVAMRRTVTEPVSDALVETNNVDVIKALLENPNARISEATMAYLVDRSKTVDSFQEPILRRRDLSPSLAKKMYFWVSAALRQHIVESFDIDVTALDNAIEAVTAEALKKVAEDADPADSGAAMVLAQRIAEANEITPQLLIQTLRQGEIPLFEALLAQLSKLRLTLIRRFLFEPGGEGLAIVCRAIDIDKSLFASIFLLSRRARPSDRVTDPRELSRILALYDRITPEAAKTVLARWRRDRRLLYAIKQVEETRSDDAAT